MDDKAWARVEALTGIAGSVIAFVGTSLYFSGLPAADDPPAEFVKYVTENRTSILNGTMCFLIGGGLLLWWAATLRAVLAEGGDRAARLGRVSLLGAAVGWAVLFAGGTAFAAVTWRGPDGLSPELVRVLVDTLNVGFGVMGAVPFFLFLFAGALAMRNHPWLPSWLVWIGLLAALFNGLPMFGLSARTGVFSPYTVIGLPGAILLFVWVIGTSLVMFRRAST